MDGERTDKMYDVIVIGAGPAGLSAAVNVRQRGGSVLVIGTAQDNNPLYKAERIDNYLGLPGLSGKEMLEVFTEHAKKMGVEFVENRVLSAMNMGKTWMVGAGSEVYEAYAVVLGGGIVRGQAYPGEKEHLGRGVSYCATCDGMLYKGKKTAVIVYGDADKKEADFLSGIGCEVTLLEKPKNVEIQDADNGVRLMADGEQYEVSCVFILRPSIAPNDLFPALELDGNFIRVDRFMKTNIDGLWAAGDCTGTPLQVSKAVGEGLIAGQAAMAHAVKQKA
ncbi:MAG: FAD-dependent oxidoreductase [Bacillota bacterium]|nr:FAD-dependent oxidoreductase [Bacillota bacterium]